MKTHFIALSLLVVPFVARAADVTATWDDSTNNWSSAAHWSSNPNFPNNGNGGFTFDAVQSSGDLTLDQNITIQKFTLNENVNFGSNFGGGFNLTLNDTLNWPTGNFKGAGTIFANGGVTLSSGGTKTLEQRTLTIGNNGTAICSGTSVRVFSGATINVLAGSTFDASNDGIMDGSDPGNGGSSFNNAGTFIKSAGTGTTEIRPAFNNTGVLNVNTGTVLLAGTGGTSTSSGQFNIAAGATLALGGTHTISSGAMITSTPTSILQISGTANVTSAVPLSLAAELRFTFGNTSPATLTLNGASNTLNVVTIPNAANVTLNGTGTLDINGLLTWQGGNLAGTSASGPVNANSGITLSTTGTKNLAARTMNIAAGTTVDWSGGTILLSNVSGTASTINNLAGATWTTTSNDVLQISGTGNVFNNAGIFSKTGGSGTTTIAPAFNNTGTVSASSGTLRFVSPPTQHSGTTLTGGTWIVNNGAQLTEDSGSNITINQGNVTLDGAGSAFQKLPSSSFFDNRGGFTIKNDSDFVRTGSFVNIGAVSIEDAPTLFSVTLAYTQNAGSTTLKNNATLTAPTVTLNGGTLSGTGTVNGAITSGTATQKIIAPGLSAGTLTVNGSATLSASTALAMEIGGTSPGTHHDRLNVSGTLALNGCELRVSLINGFDGSIAFADQFVIATAGTITGTLANINSLGRVVTTDGLGSFKVEISGTQIVLKNFSTDFTPPLITTPVSPVIAEATSAGGAVVNFSVTASDAADGAVTPTVNPPSGSTFPFGSTTVNVSATNLTGNTATASFTVTVQDTTGPALSVPASPLIAEATSASGAVVSFSVSATDLVDGARPVNVSPVSGSTFPIGDTMVNVSANDTRGNSSSTSFIVRVRDTTGPVITTPASPLVVETSSAAGAVVNFTVSASDAIDGAVTANATPASGSTFPIGDTTVNVAAQDSRGNASSASFVVRVTALPDIAVEQPPGNDLSSGATVNFGIALRAESTVTRSFTLRNSGAATLGGIGASLTSGASDQFSISSEAPPTTLVPGASFTITVTYAPTTETTHTSTLRFASDDPDESPFDLALTGTGVSRINLAQSAYVKASDTSAGAQFGRRVAVSGSTVVIGADSAHANEPGLDTGAVYVLVRDGTTGAWSQQAILRPSGFHGEHFGLAVSISADTIAVGSTLASSSVPGSVYVFVRAGTTWSEQARLTASNAQGNDLFGGSVSLSGDSLAVGARNESSSATGVNGDGSNNSASNAGAAYVFVRSGTSWSQQAYIKASNTEASDFFGSDVALQGNTLAVGAPFEDGNGTSEANNSLQGSGAVYVFARAGSAWTQQAYLKASNIGAGDFFGNTVALSGSTLVVGAPFEKGSGTGVNPADDDNAQVAGAAYVFTRSGTAWSQQALLKASNTEASDSFGSSVAVSGNIVIVGSLAEDSGASGINGDESDNSASGAGAAFVFQRTGSSWVQHDYLKASNTGAGDVFGRSVAIDGNRLVIGADQEDSNANGINGDGTNNSSLESGAAYIFDVIPPDVRVHDGDTTGAALLADNQTEAVNFGTTRLNVPVTRAFTIENARPQPLTVFFITAPTGYTVLDAPSSPIPGFGSATFFVRLDAPNTGALTGNVTLNWSQTANPEFAFPVTATVIVPPTPGTLDTTFGIGGIVHTDFNGGNDRAFCAALQDDGKIVLGGGASVGGLTEFGLARYLPDGTLDTSFRGAGKFTTGPLTAELPSLAVSDIAIFGGKIIAVGGEGESGTSNAFGSAVMVRRFLPEGSDDSSFGSGGFATFNPFAGRTLTARALAIADSGKILIGGSASGTRPFWFRLNQSGSIDAGFDPVLVPLSPDHAGTAEDLKFTSSGDLLAIGAWTSSTSGDGLTIWKQGASLEQNTLPKIGGAAAGLGEDTGMEMVLQSDGKIVFCGRRTAGSVTSEVGAGFFLGRFNPDLTLDTTFGTGGLVLQQIAPNIQDQAVSLAIDRDGKIIVAGSSTSQWMIARYLPDGTLDSGFGTNGITIFNAGANGRARKVLIAADGSIFVAGYGSNGVNQDFVLAKLNAGTAVQEIVVRDGATTGAAEILDGQATAIDFGTPRIGRPRQKTFLIQNPGNGPLAIDSITVPAGFRIVSRPGSVAPGSSATFVVELTAAALGNASGDAVIASNDLDEDIFNFPVTGTTVVNTPPVFAGFTMSTIQAQSAQVSLTKLLGKVTDANGDTVQVTGFSTTSAGGASISAADAGTLTYKPPGALVGVDSFGVTFSDGSAAITGTVNVTVTQDPAFNPKNPPQINVQPGGALDISFFGIPGRTYAIERSTDLVNWSKVGSATAGSDGIVSFSDPAPPHPAAFYRIVF